MCTRQCARGAPHFRFSLVHKTHSSLDARYIAPAYCTSASTHVKSWSRACVTTRCSSFSLSPRTRMCVWCLCDRPATCGFFRTYIYLYGSFWTCARFVAHAHVFSMLSRAHTTHTPRKGSVCDVCTRQNHRYVPRRILFQTPRGAHFCVFTHARDSHHVRPGMCTAAYGFVHSCSVSCLARCVL